MYVMLTTSLKDMTQIRARQPAVAAHCAELRRLGQGLAPRLHSASTAAASKPFFMNSVVMVIPAVLISTLLARINGYVLSPSGASAAAS